MRVLLVAPHPYFQARGTPIAERRLVEVLTRAGHEVTILAFSGGEDPGTPGSELRRIPGLPGIGPVRPGLTFAKAVLDVVLLGALLRSCRRERWDVVHAVEEAGVMALLARRLLGVPYVYDSDSHLAEQTVAGRAWLRPLGRLIERLDRAAMRGATAILAVCPALGERAAAAAPAVPVVVVEDCSLIEGAPAPVAAAEIPGGEPLVLYVGNLERYQGVELLVRAFAHAARAAGTTRARLAIVGGQPRQVASLRTLARSLGVAERVDLLGPRPLGELGGLLAQATVLVSPRLEGLNTPMKVYSYLDSGRPLLATRVTAHTQILDEDSALLAEPLPGPFGDALVRLLRDPALRDRLAAGGRRAVRERLTPESQERKLVELYASVAARLSSHAAVPARPGGDSPARPPELSAEVTRAGRPLPP